MITQWFMEFLHSLAVGASATVSALVPSPPTFIADLTSGIETAYGMVPGPMRYFVPIAPMVTIGTVFVGLLVVLGMVRLARRVLSLFTGGGGNA